MDLKMYEEYLHLSAGQFPTQIVNHEQVTQGAAHSEQREGCGLEIGGHREQCRNYGLS